MKQALKTYVVDYENAEAFAHCCGVLEVGGFDINYEYDDNHNPVDFPADYVPTMGRLDESGSGLFVSTFINNPKCKAAYEALCREHVLLYQSPVKENKRSHNRLFLCVFLHANRKGKAKKQQQQVWPAQERDGEKLPRF